jgi:DNA-binding transcriptional LysR family regulator
LLDSSGLDPHWVADTFERGATLVDTSGERDDRDRDDGDNDRSRIWFCWHRRHFLSPRERSFIESIRTWRGPLSEKQRIWLGNICERLEAT